VKEEGRRKKEEGRKKKEGGRKKKGFPQASIEVRYSVTVNCYAAG
jgi:hypothetical protein